jgi:hypothetical protein
VAGSGTALGILLLLKAAQCRAPGGVEIGSGREAVGELEINQSVRQSPESTSTVLITPGLDARPQALTRQGFRVASS